MDFNTKIQDNTVAVQSSAGSSQVQTTGAGNSSAPNTVFDTKSSTSQINEELLKKILERYPDFLSKTQEEQAKILDEFNNTGIINSNPIEQQAEMPAEENKVQNSVTVDNESVLYMQTEDIEPFNHAEYHKLTNEQKEKVFIDEFAKNIFMFEQEDEPRSLSQWNNLDAELKEQYRKKALEADNSYLKKGKFSSEDDYAKYLEAKMLELKIADNDQKTLEQFRNLSKIKKEEAKHNYLFQFSDEANGDKINDDIKYYNKSQIDKTSALYTFFKTENFEHGNEFDFEKPTPEGQDEIKKLCLNYVLDKIEKEKDVTEDELRLAELDKSYKDGQISEDEYNVQLNKVTHNIQTIANIKFYQDKTGAVVLDENNNLSKQSLSDLRANMRKLSKDESIEMETSPEEIYELITELKNKENLNETDKTRLQNLEKLYNLKKLNKYTSELQIKDSMTPEYKEGAEKAYNQFLEKCPEYNKALTETDRNLILKDYLKEMYPNDKRARAKAFRLIMSAVRLQGINNSDRSEYIQKASESEQVEIANTDNESEQLQNASDINSFGKTATETHAEVTKNNEKVASLTLTTADDEHYEHINEPYSASENLEVQFLNSDRAFACQDTEIQYKALENIYNYSKQEVKEYTAIHIDEANPENYESLINLYKQNENCAVAMAENGTEERCAENSVTASEYQSSSLSESYDSQTNQWTSTGTDVRQGTAAMDEIIAADKSLHGGSETQFTSESFKSYGFSTISDAFSAFKNKEISFAQLKDILNRASDEDYRKMLLPMIQTGAIKSSMLKFLIKSKPDLFLSLLEPLISMGKGSLLLDYIKSNTILAGKVLAQLFQKGSATEKIAAAKLILKSPSEFPKELVQQALEIKDNFSYAFTTEDDSPVVKNLKPLGMNPFKA